MSPNNQKKNQLHTSEGGLKEVPTFSIQTLRSRIDTIHTTYSQSSYGHDADREGARPFVLNGAQASRDEGSNGREAADLTDVVVSSMERGIADTIVDASSAFHSWDAYFKMVKPESQSIVDDDLKLAARLDGMGKEVRDRLRTYQMNAVAPARRLHLSIDEITALLVAHEHESDPVNGSIPAATPDLGIPAIGAKTPSALKRGGAFIRGQTGANRQPRLRGTLQNGDLSIDSQEG